MYVFPLLGKSTHHQNVEGGNLERERETESDDDEYEHRERESDFSSLEQGLAFQLIQFLLQSAAAVIKCDTFNYFLFFINFALFLFIL